MIENILWQDAEMESVEISYDSVSLKILEATDRVATVVAKGYIGYRLVGFWDEVVIDSALLHIEHEFTNKCIVELDARLGSHRGESGSEARNRGGYQSLELRLIDGCSLWICAGEFETVFE